MARVEERVHIHRPTEQVWQLLVRWEDQPAWMQDAQSVTVTSDQREGVGTVIHVPTNIALGLVVPDEMRVTEWVEGEKSAVLHTGPIIKGHGAFELTPTRLADGRQGSLFPWWEQIDALLGRLGDVSARNVAVPYVSHIFRRSLRALKQVAEDEIPEQPVPDRTG